MPRYDRGYRPRGGYGTGNWDNPYGYDRGMHHHRGRSGERPWVGGYRDGYQGGSGGMNTQGGPTMRRGDEWWLGGHHPGRYDEEYDRAYRDFDRQSHPRFSPIGGTYAAMGGAYGYSRPPRPLREDMWFSDWTRWF